MPYRSLALAVACALTLALAPHAPLPAGALAAAPAKAGGPAAVPDELVVGFAPTADPAAWQAVAARSGGRILRRLDSINAALVRLPTGRPLAAEARALARDPAVRYAEPNFIYRASHEPDDPDFGALWGLRNTGQLVGDRPGVPGADVGAATAWETTTGSRDVVVGVVDTGIDYAHPDLAANIWRAPAGWSLAGCGAGTRGYRVVGGAASCDPLDDHDHGTHVAGTIGAEGDNGVGVAGVNWRVSLLGLKFLDAGGGGSLADAIAVLDYAVRAKQAGVNLRVLNASWGCDGCYSQALLEQIKLAGDHDILFVAAAGNSAGRNDNDIAPAYPAAYAAANLVAVAATDNRDDLADFSHYGATSVHLGAPGVRVHSTARNGRYATFSGTSMATPHVAGGAALVLAAPGLGGLGTAELKRRLLQCGDPAAALAGRTLTGKRLNVARAIAGCPAPDYTLSVAAEGGGRVSVAPAGPTHPAGTDVWLAATPDEGYAFVGWMVDGRARRDPTGPAPLLLGMYRDLSVVALFAPAPPNDDFPGVAVEGLPFRDTLLTNLATTQPGEPTGTPGVCAPVARTVWYAVTPAAAATLAVDTAGSDFDTVVAVYTGARVDALRPVPGGCNDDSAGTRQSRVTFQAEAGAIYYVQVGGYMGAGGRLAVGIAGAPPAP